MKYNMLYLCFIKQLEMNTFEIILICLVTLVILYSSYKAITYPIKLMRGEADFKKDLEEWWNE